MNAQEVTRLRKAGLLNDALALAKKLWHHESSNIHNQRAMGWVYIECIKTICFDLAQLNHYLTEIQGLKLDDSEEIFWEQLRWQVAKVLFGLTRPSTSQQWKITMNLLNIFPCQSSTGFSTLIKSILKHQIEIGNLALYTTLFKITNFQEIDYFSTSLVNGKEIPPLIERVYIALSKSWIDLLNSKQTTSTASELLVFLKNIDTISIQYPSMIYLVYYRAIIRIALGRVQEARNLFIPFAQKKQRDFWVWDVLAQLYNQDTEKQIACLAKALSCKASNDFLVKVRQKMTELLIIKQQWEAAKTEIACIIATRRQHQWHIPAQVTDWLALPEINNAIQYTNNKELYQSYALFADELLHHNLLVQAGIIWKINTAKNTAQFFVSETINGGFQLGVIKQPVKVGDVFLFTLREIKKEETLFWKVHSVRQLENHNLQGLQKKFQGYLKIFGKVGIVGDVFIEECLLINHIGLVEGDAIRHFNNKKQQWGWKALHIRPSEQ